MKKYDVAIVGFGPTGGTLANLLALQGFSILIIEKEKSFYPLPRAVHFDDERMKFRNKRLETASQGKQAPLLIDCPWLYSNLKKK